jgi:hypothetical protein
VVALPPGKESPVPIAEEAGWAPEPVWKLWRREKEKRNKVLKECKKWREE